MIEQLSLLVADAAIRAIRGRHGCAHALHDAQITHRGIPIVSVAIPLADARSIRRAVHENAQATA